VGVQNNAVGLRVAVREPGLPREGLFRCCWIWPALGELLPGDPTHEPSVASKFVVHLFEQCGTRPLGTPAAMEGSTVHAGGHEADDLRFHGEPSDTQSKLLSKLPVPA
jgi:hypothetical protein